MAIVIRMKDQSEYVVQGEYTISEFRHKYINVRDDYVSFNAQSGTASIPTMLVKENIISVQEKDMKVRASMRSL